MTHLLVDGTNVDLSLIEEITEIRDYGYDETTIEKSLVKFTIRFKNGTSIPVKSHYHYNDWHSKVKELRKIRLDLLGKWEEYKAQIV